MSTETIETKDLRKLITTGDLRGLRRLKQDHMELPSLDGETFRNLEVTGMDLSFLDLSNTEWDTCIIHKSDFRGANLSGAFFTGCTILESNFDKSTLGATAFDGCVMRDTTFREVVFDGVELTGSELAKCTFENVELIETLWESVTVKEGVLCNLKAKSGTWSGLTFREVVVENVDVSGIEVQSCVASGDLLPGFTALTGRRKHIQ